MNIAVLFGAGASYGAGPVSPHEPPLGGQLFEALKSAYPDSWGSLLDPEKNATFQEDFEHGMAMLWADQGDSAQRLIIDMALYFTRFRLAGPNFYSALLSTLFRQGSDHRVIFATLNYDCLFEQAVTKAGLSIRSLWRVVGTGQSALQLLKLHGSCNYLSPMTRNMKNVRLGPVGVAYIDSEVPGPSDLEIVPQDEVLEIYTQAGGTLPPAISLYEPTKHSPVGGGLIQKVREEWAALVPEADVESSIGARPVAQDEHIWAPIQMSDAQVWFVGGRDADYGRRAWALGDRMTYLGFTFEESIPMIRDKLDSPPPDKKLWTPSG